MVCVKISLDKPQVPCQPHIGDLIGCTNSSSRHLLSISLVKTCSFQAEEKQRRENLEKIMEENQRKIEEQNKKMVSVSCTCCKGLCLRTYYSYVHMFHLSLF